MKIWVLTVLLVLNITSIRGAKMPRNNILGLHFDILKLEANVVVGRKQAIFEVMGNDPGTNPAAALPVSSRQVSPDPQLWNLEDGHITEMELRPVSVQNRWVARPTGGRPLRYHFLEPMVFQSSNSSAPDPERDDRK